MPKVSKTKDPMDAVLANIEKNMGNRGGKSRFARFKDIETSDEPVISFGVPVIDEASYCGGVPRGKLVEIFGPESSGKSLTTLFLIASAQRAGLECALIDIEQSFDPFWAKQHGVNVDNLVYSNDFDNGEQALEYAFQICKTGAFGLVVIDSTAALIPQSELDGSLEDNARVGAQAQIMSRGCRKIVDACGKSDTTCVFVNQIRSKIGVMYGNPETTPGGRSLKFYAHQRLRVARKGNIKVKEGGKDTVVGQLSTITFVKNKTARPFGQCEFRIIFDPTSLNPVVMLVNALKDAKIVYSHSKIFRIKGNFLNKKKNIETNAASMVELADYIIENNLVIPLIEALKEEVEDTEIDGAILELLEDPSKIVSPIGQKKSVDVKRIDNASVSEVEEMEQEGIDEEEEIAE